MLKISIVIPLYNKESSVWRAVNSVLSQSFGCFELIIVDDGSTDNSLSVVNDFDDSRIRLIRQINSGVSATRNKGFEKSSGDYVCFLDADDEWYPWFLEEIVELIIISPMSSIYCARYEIVSEKSVPFVGSLALPDSFVGVLNDFFKIYKKSRSLICSSNVCVSRKYFGKLGGFPLSAKTGEDIYVWLNLALFSSVCFSSKISARVHRDAQNRTISRVDAELPYYLRYFFIENPTALLVNDAGYSASLKAFLLKSSVINSSAAVVRGHRRLAREYAFMLLRWSAPFSFLVFIISFLPISFFSLAKKVRNNLTTRSI